MLKVGYLLDLLEKLPHETEVNFYSSMDSNATVYEFENDGGCFVESDEENIIINEAGVIFILNSY